MSLVLVYHEVLPGDLSLSRHRLVSRSRLYWILSAWPMRSFAVAWCSYLVQTEKGTVCPDR